MGDTPDRRTRIRNRAVLEPLLDEVFSSRAVAEWMDRLQAAGIPASPVRNFEDVVGHPQSDVRKLFPTLHHPSAGAHRVTGTPVKLSDTPGGPSLPAPLLGQHTRETLGHLVGLTADEIDSLAARGVVYEAADGPA